MRISSQCSALLFFTLLSCQEVCFGFTSPLIHHRPTTTSPLRANADDNSSSNVLTEQAERLLSQAREIRASLPDEPKVGEPVVETVTTSPWNVPGEPDENSVDYRLYLDIGREPGTWMDPRWGASGKRIECTIDVRFLLNSVADESVAKKIVDDNRRGQRSPVYTLLSAENARLRGGFDKMKCQGGGYRIDKGANGVNTVRFFLETEGTSDSSYGDISIPKGCLYVSLPVFGRTMASQLSTKEGPVTVRQRGWNTGFPREESRIVGVVRAKPIQDALRIDKF